MLSVVLNMPTGIPPSLKEKLSHKHVLLDSNFLIEASNSSDDFRSVIDCLQEAPCQPVLFSLVEFEIFRTSFQSELREAKRAYLDSWNCMRLPMGQALFADAVAFGNYYASIKIAPSLADCFIAAFLKQHHKDLFLITRNHKDFPPPLFIREESFLIERPRDILAFGVYRFDETRQDLLIKYQS